MLHEWFKIIRKCSRYLCLYFCRFCTDFFLKHAENYEINLSKSSVETMRVRLIEVHDRCRVLIGEQVYSSHKYEFAVTASQFRFITIDLVASDARTHTEYWTTLFIQIGNYNGGNLTRVIEWMNEWMKIYIAHISSQFCFECSRRLADVLAISSGCLTHERDQRYAATGARSTVFNHIEIHACWVFWCFCNPPNSDMDYRIFIVRAWSSACVHTLDLGLTSHPKDETL